MGSRWGWFFPLLLALLWRAAVPADASGQSFDPRLAPATPASGPYQQPSNVPGLADGGGRPPANAPSPGAPAWPADACPVLSGPFGPPATGPYQLPANAPSPGAPGWPAAAVPGPASLSPPQPVFAAPGVEPSRLPPPELIPPGEPRFAPPCPPGGPPVGPGWPADARPALNGPFGPPANSVGAVPGQVPPCPPNLGPIAPGAVHGRLSNRGCPLVNCQVVLVPMHEEDGVCCFDRDRKVLTAVTDERGEYRFENVSVGGYKITWLPQGQTRWIRRIAMVPDVKVHSGETTQSKEIRIALQTIN